MNKKLTILFSLLVIPISLSAWNNKAILRLSTSFTVYETNDTQLKNLLNKKNVDYTTRLNNELTASGLANPDYKPASESLWYPSINLEYIIFANMFSYKIKAGYMQWRHDAYSVSQYWADKPEFSTMYHVVPFELSFGYIYSFDSKKKHNINISGGPGFYLAFLHYSFDQETDIILLGDEEFKDKYHNYGYGFHVETEYIFTYHMLSLGVGMQYSYYFSTEYNSDEGKLKINNKGIDFNSSQFSFFLSAGIIVDF